jgi:hypothetical protein
MDLQRLNEITDLDGAQQDDWWRAIEDLAQDLDDVLVVDQRLKLKDDGDPKSLTIFRCPTATTARAPNSTPCSRSSAGGSSLGAPTRWISALDHCPWPTTTRSGTAS